MDSINKCMLKWGAIVGGVMAIPIIALYYSPRETVETRPLITNSQGLVVEKQVVEGTDLSALVFFNPLFLVFSPSDKYNTSIKIGPDTLIYDNEPLFDDVSIDDRVYVDYHEMFYVTKSHKGELLREKFKGFYIVDVRK